MTVPDDTNPPRRERPRLLFICQVLPYPPDGGVLIRSYHTLRILSQAYDVFAVCFERASGRGSTRSVEAAEAALAGFAEVVSFPIPQERSRLRWLWDHARSMITGRVYTRYVYENAVAHARVRDLLVTTRFDLAHLDSLDLSSFLPLLKGLPVAIAHHNIESELLQRRAKLESSMVRTSYLQLQARLMRREEARLTPSAALNVVVSEQDAATLAEIAPEARIAVLPNGVDTDAFAPATEPPDPGTVVFVGGATWFPNRDALHYFATTVFPLIRHRRPDATVTWVGRSVDADRDLVGTIPGLRVTGYVDDIRPFVHRAACYVVPIRVGGGTRLKILDAWAMGKAVVSTPQGCEGLAAQDGINILVRSDPQTFADAVCRVLADAELAGSLGTAARRTAVDVYSWDVIGTRMKAEYLRLVQP